MLFWGVIIFLQWQNCVDAHVKGDFDASYYSYGIMLFSTLLAMLSTWTVVATVSWLTHKRLTKTHFSPVIEQDRRSGMAVPGFYKR